MLRRFPQQKYPLLWLLTFLLNVGYVPIEKTKNFHNSTFSALELSFEMFPLFCSYPALNERCSCGC
jgi:hypothetical protein